MVKSIDKGIEFFITMLNAISLILFIKISYKIVDINYFYCFIVFIFGYFVFSIFKIIKEKHLNNTKFKFVVLFLLPLILICTKNILYKFFSFRLTEQINIFLYTIKSSSNMPKFTGMLILTSSVLIFTFIFLYVFQKNLEDVFIIISVIILMIYSYYFNLSYEISNNIAYFIIIDIVTYGVYNYKIYSKKVNIKKIISLLVEALIFTAVVCIIPKDYEGITQKVNMVNSGDFNLGINKKEYNLSKSGYSDSSKKLGGSVKIDKSDAFRINFKDEITQKQKIEFLYLRGSVKSKYTGYSWENTYTEYVQDDTIYSNLKSNSNENNKTLLIQPINLYTRTIFSPLYSISVEMEDKSQRIFKDIDNDKFFLKTYQKKSYEILYKDIDSKMLDNLKISEGIEKNVLNDGFSKFLKVPETVTDRTRALVLDVTKGCKNTNEKVNAIKKYLEKNYFYTTEVNDVTHSNDFVDNFLFQEKKGYCVYFATAMTVMCRIAGVPSRYVEGFKIDMNGINGDKSLTVTNQNAHAWTEIYIPCDFKNNSSDAYGGIWITEDTSPMPAQLENKKDENLINRNFQNENNKSIASFAEGELYKKIVYSIKLAIFMILTILFGIIIITNFYRKNKSVKSNSYKPLYKNTLRRLKVLGYKKKENETDKEFINNIKDSELRVFLNDLIDLLYKEVYGEELDLNYDKIVAYKFLENYIKEKTGKMRYFISKINIF